MRKVEPITAGQLAEFQGRLVRCLEQNGVGRDEFQDDFVQGGIINELLALRMPDWLKHVLERERQCHKDFFSQEFDLGGFKSTLRKYGQEAVIRWQELGLEPHYLPSVVMRQDVAFPCWKVKPENWYYQKVAEGKILRRQPDGSFQVDPEAYKLEGVTVLVDVRLKPKYDGGGQMFENDNLVGPIIERLRKKKKIAEYEYGQQSSRFGISAEEWEGQIKSALADFLQVDVSQVRLERAIEANVIPQLYPYMPRQKDGQTDVWMWYGEYFEDAFSRLLGGGSYWGGLSGVCCYWADYRRLCGAVRPLVVLDN